MKNPEQIPDILQKYRNSRLRIGFSGGADSTALLLMLLKWQWQPSQLEAVHFEHGLRGEASRLDAAWCADFCKKHKIRFTLVELDLAKRFADCASIEDLARNERLMWYRQHDDGTPVVLAHHAGDAVENVLLKLARGGNASALSSLRSCRKLWNLTVLRPLLDYPKSYLEDFLRANGVDDWRIDSSNESCDYHRNYLRNELLLQWSKYHSPVIAGVLQAGKVLAMDADFIESAAAGKLAELGEPLPEKTSCSFWYALHPALLGRVLRSYIAQISGETDCSLSQKQIAIFQQAIQQMPVTGRKQLQLSCKWSFLLQENMCVFSGSGSQSEEADALQPQIWNWQEAPETAFGQWLLKAELLDGANWVAGDGIYCFDADLMPENLQLDIRRGGELMTVWGEETPRRVKHILSACQNKDNMLIVRTKPDEICILGNLRRGNVCAVTGETVRSLRITVKRLDAV